MRRLHGGTYYETTTASGCSGCVELVNTSIGYMEEESFKIQIDDVNRCMGCRKGRTLMENTITQYGCLECEQLFFKKGSSDGEGFTCPLCGAEVKKLGEDTDE